jgi:hypothetical protein
VTVKFPEKRRDEGSHMTMRKRLLGVGFVLAAVLGGGYVTLWLTAPQPPRHRINPDSFTKIKKGMPRTEVEAILRVPAGDYSRIKPDWDVRFDYLPGKHEYWHSDAFSIWISFDDAGLVLSTADYTRQRFEESIFDRLRRALGIR